MSVECEPLRKMEYRGITYPFLLAYFGWQEWLWKKFMCSRNVHLFDECLSGGSCCHGDGFSEHYLVCDVCQLMIYIDKFDAQYVKP